MATAVAAPLTAPIYETGFKKWIITVTVIVSAMIELIDTSIVNVALSEMSGNLGATIEDVAWVVTAYAIANVIIIPMASFLGAKLGRRNYYIGSIILFTAASFMCGNAGNIWVLVFFRFVQGIGGGALLSTSQTILFETFKPEDRGLASGIFGLGIVIGPTIGPTLGGWIVDNYSWPWIFYVNIPVGTAAALLSYSFIKEPAEKRSTNTIDWTGIGLLIVGIGSLQTVLERGEAEDWFETGYIVVLTIVAVVSLLTFIWWELRTDEPVVDLHVIAKSPALAIAATLTFVFGYGVYASTFILPVFAQRLLGFNALQAGLMLLPGALCAAFCLPIVGKAVGSGVPTKPLVFTGFVFFITFCYILSKSTLASGQDDFFWPLMLRGSGLAMLTVPLTVLATSGLKGKDIGQAAGLNNMMRQLGGSFGIAIVNTYITKRVAAHRLDLVSDITIFDTATQERMQSLTRAFVAQGSSIADAQRKAYAALDGIITRQSMQLSYMDAFLFVALFFVCCLPLIFIVRQPKPEGKISVSLDH
jgi:DHA2 family multidrug resistance protein